MRTGKSSTFSAKLCAGKTSMPRDTSLKILQVKNSTLQLARRKIDALGNMKAHGCIINDENAIGKLENRLKLAECSPSFPKRTRSQRAISKLNTAMSLTPSVSILSRS